MKTTDKHIYLLIGGFILDNKRTMIRFLNQGGYAQLKPNASIQDINDAVAYHITDNDFVTKLITLIAKSQGDGYSYMIEIDAIDVGSGGGGGRPSRFSRIHLPRFTGEVRVGFEVMVRMLAWVRSPTRPVPLSETLVKSPAGTLGIP